MGVVTKIDKCERGIRAKLECRSDADLKLALGYPFQMYFLSPFVLFASILILLSYVAVRNRTQEEIDKCVGFSQARQNEEDYFNNHPELMDMPPHFKGTKQVRSTFCILLILSLTPTQLASKLTEIQAERIRSTLPKVRDTIRDRLRAQRTELASLPTELSSGSDCSHRFVLPPLFTSISFSPLFRRLFRCYRFTELVQKFTQMLSQLIHGDYGIYMPDNEMRIIILPTKEIKQR